MYKSKTSLQIVEGKAPYGISTSDRITKALLRQHKPVVCKPNVIKIAQKYLEAYQSSPNNSMEKIGKKFGVSRVRIHQMLSLLSLDKRILTHLTQEKNQKIVNYWTGRKLRNLLKLDTTEQYVFFNKNNKALQ